MKTGLTDEEVIIARKTHGTNEIAMGKGRVFCVIYYRRLGTQLLKYCLLH